MCDIILSLKCRCIDFQEVRGKNWGRKQLTIDKRANLGVSVDRRGSLKEDKRSQIDQIDEIIADRFGVHTSLCWHLKWFKDMRP